MQLTFMRKIRLLAYSGDRLKQANVYLQNWLAIEEALLCGGGVGVDTEISTRWLDY